MDSNHLKIDHLISNAGIDALNEMQQTAVESFPASGGMILSSPTGSGKTLAFLLMMVKVMLPKYKGTFAIIITPTRELALQITDVFQSLKTGLKITACYGGHKREIEENNLIEAPSVIVGTPGRLSDHIKRGNIKTDTIRLAVLDEFDKSLEMGFLGEMEFLFSSFHHIDYKVLVSATPVEDVPEFVKLEGASVLNFSHEKEPALGVHQVSIEMVAKELLLFQLLCTIGNRKTIVFANQKETVTNLCDYLKENGITTVAYHGSMEQRDREVSISKFRNGSVPFLITTDLASRGLDVSNIRFIIHYDLPETEQVYIHRNGRTARMDASGEAILFTMKKGVPSYLNGEMPEFRINSSATVPDKSEWGTLFFSAGKKDKVNKMDIAGFLMQRAGLKREDTGLIEIKDFYSFAAVRRSKMSYIIGLGKEQKIKNKKVKVAAAR